MTVAFHLENPVPDVIEDIKRTVFAARMNNGLAIVVAYAAHSAVNSNQVNPPASMVTGTCTL